MPGRKDYYDILGVSWTATKQEIENAYRTLAMKYHPDSITGDKVAKELAKEKFQEVQEAYSVLSNNTKKSDYDSGFSNSQFLSVSVLF